MGKYNHNMYDVSILHWPAHMKVYARVVLFMRRGRKLRYCYHFMQHYQGYHGITITLVNLVTLYPRAVSKINLLTNFC